MFNKLRHCVGKGLYVLLHLPSYNQGFPFDSPLKSCRYIPQFYSMTDIFCISVFHLFIEVCSEWNIQSLHFFCCCFLLYHAIRERHFIHISIKFNLTYLIMNCGVSTELSVWLLCSNNYADVFCVLLLHFSFAHLLVKNHLCCLHCSYIDMY